MAARLPPWSNAIHAAACWSADHKRFSLATDNKRYFCDPQRPWQRGSNEQINGLLRQYFPKGMDLSGDRLKLQPKTTVRLV